MNDATNQTGKPSSDAQAMMMFEANKKSTGLAYVIWFFLGMLGVHRIYLGRTTSGIVMLILGILGLLLSVAGGIGLILLIPVWIWLLVDAFLIPGMARAHNIAIANQMRT